MRGESPPMIAREGGYTRRGTPGVVTRVASVLFTLFTLYLSISSYNVIKRTAKRARERVPRCASYPSRGVAACPQVKLGLFGNKPFIKEARMLHDEHELSPRVRKLLDDGAWLALKGYTADVEFAALAGHVLAEFPGDALTKEGAPIAGTADLAVHACVCVC